MILVKGGHVLVMEDDVPARPIRADVEIHGNQISAVHSHNAVGPFDGTVIDATGCAVLPGLVNGHAHLRPMRALGEGLDVRTWHDKLVDGTSMRMTEEDAYRGALNAFAEMLKNGITTVQAMSILDAGELRAARDVGIRARLARHAERQSDLDETFETARSQGGTEDQRVRLWLGLEHPDMFDDEQLASVAEEAAALRLPIHTHFSEHKQDDVNRLERCGLLEPRLILAHCVHVDEEDSKRLCDAGVAVMHNPKSNLRFGNGVAPIARYLEQGIAVGLGTDGPLSTYSCDVFEEARVATLIARGTSRDPRSITVDEALYLATGGGATALGLEDQIGSLSPGTKADVIVIDLDTPKFRPLFAEGPIANLVAMLLFTVNGNDVRDVIVDGSVVVRDRQIVTIDEAEIMAGCQQSGQRILSEILEGDDIPR